MHLCTIIGESLEKVICEVEKSLPSEGSACHRVLISYSWLLFATFQVCTITVLKTMYTVLIYIVYFEYYRKGCICSMLP